MAAQYHADLLPGHQVFLSARRPARSAPAEGHQGAHPKNDIPNQSPILYIETGLLNNGLRSTHSVRADL